MTADPRPLSARVDAYVANLRSIASQVEYLAQVLKAKNLDPSPLLAMVELQNRIADDLETILNGEKLAEFRIEGIIQ